MYKEMILTAIVSAIIILGSALLMPPPREMTQDEAELVFLLEFTRAQAMDTHH